MLITVNGEQKDFAQGLTIEGLLKRLNIISAMVAIEHNRKILKREDFSTTVINDGDKIEIIKFVGGG